MKVIKKTAKKSNTVAASKSVTVVGGNFAPMIRSRHPSHRGLRTGLKKLPFRSVIRLGSLTELDDAASVSGTRVELNSPDAIRNSSSKLKMKRCFLE